jgi:MFS family permease
MAQESSNISSQKKTGLFYGYVIVLAAFFIVLISWGAMYSFGVFFKPVLAEFGWTRAMTSGAYALNMVLTGAFCILSGKLVGRLGPRMVLTIGGAIIGVGYLLMSRSTTVLEFYLYYGLLVSIGMGCMVVPLMWTVARWFNKGRGLASGIVISGIGLGIIVMPQLANRLISVYSWRTSFLFLGIISLVLIIGFAQLLKRAPAPNQHAGKASASNVQVKGLTVREAMRTSQFWLIFIMPFFLSFAVQVVMAHIVPHATDIGFSATTAATLLSAIGLVSIFGKISFGSLGDKIGNRKAAIIISILVAVAFVWLRFSNQLWMLYIFAVIFGLGYAGFSATQSPLAAELFGLKSHGTIFGLTSFTGNAGGAVGSFLAGYIFDMTGNYNWAFYICVILAAISLIISIALHPVNKTAPSRIRVGRRSTAQTTS